MRKAGRPISLKAVREKMMIYKAQHHMNPNDETAFNKLMGIRLRFARVSRGKTQMRVAKAIGKTFQQVQKYEKGTNGVSSQKLWKISRYLGFSYKWMFSAFKHKEEINNDYQNN